MKKFIFGLILALSSFLSAQEPNIIVILIDDMGYGDLSVYNPGAKTTTPHLNSLASDGMRFTDFHTNSAVCTPTRYGLLTGRYA
ncbi:sulfatase-like hydrolase/transferase [bacterium]|nr:sulfatase-like hydrolase/transferase [bacterium]